MPLQQAMPVLFVGEPIVLGFSPIQGKPVAQLAALMPGTSPTARRLQAQCASAVAMGPGLSAENTERIRVFTITITAPQQVQTIGARCLNHAKA